MKLKAFLRDILAVFFVMAGMNHFRVPSMYVSVVPAWLPWPANLSAIAGVCEILGGVGILLPGLRRAAGWGLVALLVAVFPANLNAALVRHMQGSSLSPAMLWARLPLQAVLIAWVAWVAVARDRRLGI
ncbi:MAG TPA: DoxX family protein [Opitutaceae bacterium]|nr:DoxX family protein [Opitutaceae bacterium]